MNKTKLDPELKKEIDNMSQYNMARIWRFGGRDDLLSGDMGRHFKDVFLNKKGGFTPEISKQLGWS